MSVCVFVTVTIPEDKVEEFMKVMKIDVDGSRAEEGCLGFDLLKGECRMHECDGRARKAARFLYSCLCAH